MLCFLIILIVKLFSSLKSNSFDIIFLIVGGDTLNLATLAKMVFFNLRDKEGIVGTTTVGATDGIWNGVSNWFEDMKKPKNVNGV